jgi:anti-anti-sigma factor
VSDLATLSISGSSEQLVAEIAGEIDLSNASSLEWQITEATADCPALIVDLSALTYMDSAGVNLIRNLATQAIDRGQALRIVAPSDSPARVLLDLMSIQATVPVDESYEPAV